MASKNFINECKNRAYKNRLGKLIVDGMATPITNSDNLKSLAIDSGCYVDGNIIGSIYVKCLTGELLDTSNINLVDKTAHAQIGVKYADLSDEYVSMGKYTVERPNNEITANMTQFTAYDDLMNKINNKYVCGIDYSDGNKTLSDLYIDICNQLELTPVTTTFINSSIPILNNPFTNGEKNRTVLQTVAKIASSFVDIDNDTNKINLCWLSQNEEPDYTFLKNDYASVDGGQVVCGPINCLTIKNSQIDDENVTIKDEESIALYGEHSIIISEDYVLYNAELRQQAITSIWNRVHNMTYVDCKLTTYYGKPFLKLGDKIRVYTNDSDYFDTYVLKHTFTYDGSFTSVIESPALTEQEISTKQDIGLAEALSNTQIEVNKQDERITATVERVDEQEERVTQQEITIDGITDTVSRVETDVENANTSILELRRTADEMNLEIRKTGNNILKGTTLFDFSDWGRQTTLPYVESPTPPDPTVCSKWYCTEDNDSYVNGKIYLYNDNDNEWQLLNTTRKELEEQSKLLWGVSILKDTSAKDNFYSQKFVKFAPYSLSSSGQAVLSTKCTDIQPSEEKLTLSYRLQNKISQGDFSISVFIYSVYKDLEPSINKDAIFTEKILFTPDEMQSLTLNTYQLDIPKTANLIDAVVSETEPTTELNYWLKPESIPLYCLYERGETGWTLSGNKHGCRDDEGNIYYYCGNSNGKNIFWLLDGGEYIARQVYLDFSLDCHYIDYIQEEAPTPFRNCYWAKESADQVFRARYDSEEFVEWVLLDTTYQEAVSNATEDGVQLSQPFVKPIGEVYLGDIKLEYGDYSEWSSNPNEITGQNYNFNDKGFTIQKGNTKMYIDDDEIKATNNNVISFNLDDDKLLGNKGVFNELHIQELKTVKMTMNSKEMFCRYIDDGGDS